MHIAILIDSLAGGGAERVMLTLAKALARQGHVCRILTLLEGCDHHVPETLPVHCLGLSGLVPQSFPASHLKSWLQKLEGQFGAFDAHISNLDKTNLAVAKLDLPNTLYVIHNSVEDTLRSRYKQPFKWWMIRQSLKALSGKDVIAVSLGVAAGITRSALIEPRSLRTIYNPLDFDEVKTLASESVHELPAEPYLIHVGRVARQKRHDILFQALATTKEPIKLVCLCRNVKKARNLAKKYGVEDRVILPGFKANPYPWIKHAKGLVLSSDFEGFAMVLVEALSLGVPVVSTDCDFGPREILTGPLAHWLVPTGSPAALGEKIDALVSAGDLTLSPPILEEIIDNKAAARYLRALDVNTASLERIAPAVFANERERSVC